MPGSIDHVQYVDDISDTSTMTRNRLVNFDIASRPMAEVTSNSSGCPQHNQG
jgi:hypothetical protein